MGRRYALLGCALALLGNALIACATGADINAPATQANGPLANNQATRVRLDIPADSYFANPEGRNILKYLVRCALDADTEAELSLPGEKLTFAGGVGLAPEWLERALTLNEQRWVSACIFALTNKLGKTVKVDLRAAHPKIGTDTEEEKLNYPLHEGGFFGNLFAPEPFGYVCEGANRKKLRDVPIGQLRLCAQPSGKTTPDGQPLSECGFIITGSCNSPASFVVNGEHFDEVVHTWLPPEPLH